MHQTVFERKVRIAGRLIFDTAFHIGSGKEGEMATDLGVLKDAQGWPVLPGSTLKGCFRAAAEKLAGYLGQSACLLDTTLSGQDCVGDQDYFKQVNEAFKRQKGEAVKLAWLGRHTCDVCRFFGSPLQASRIFFSDGQLARWQGRYQVRDGVVIDRDSGTARPRLKYDFEVAPRHTVFELLLELENPAETELALTGAVLAEWQNGFRLGGFTSRGLGRVFLEDLTIEQVDYTDATQLQAYLLTRALTPVPDLLHQALHTTLMATGGAPC